MIKRKPLWVLLFAVLFQYPVISRFLRDVAWTGLIINIKEELPVFHGVYLFRNIHMYIPFSHCCSYRCCCDNFICILTKRRVFLAFLVAPSRTWQGAIAVVAALSCCCCLHKPCMRMCVFLTHLCCICVKNFVVYQALLGAATFVLNASVSACLCVRVCVCVYTCECVLLHIICINIC